MNDLASPKDVRLSQNMPQFEGISLDVLRYAFFGALSYEAGVNLNQFLTGLRGYLSININSIRIGENTRKHLKRIKDNSENIQHLNTSLQELFVSFSESSNEIDHLSYTLQDIVTLCQTLFPPQCSLQLGTVDFDGKIDISESKLKEMFLYLLWHAKEQINGEGNIHIYSSHVLHENDKDFLSIQIEVQSNTLDNNGNAFLSQNTMSIIEVSRQISIYLAHQLAHQHGCILKEKFNNKTLNYKLQLPIQQPQQKSAQIKELWKNRYTPNPPLKIVLLEDQELISEFIQERLRLDGHYVETYNNGLMLKETLQNRDLSNYDLFMLDIFVPGISGLEVGHFIRSKDKHSRILFYSALTSQFTISRQFTLDSKTQFLPKPFKTEEMIQKIQKITSIPRQDEKQVSLRQ